MPSAAARETLDEEYSRVYQGADLQLRFFKRSQVPKMLTVLGFGLQGPENSKDPKLRNSKKCGHFYSSPPLPSTPLLPSSRAGERHRRWPPRATFRPAGGQSFSLPLPLPPPRDRRPSLYCSAHLRPLYKTQTEKKTSKSKKRHDIMIILRRSPAAGEGPVLHRPRFPMSCPSKPFVFWLDVPGPTNGFQP